MTPEIKRRALLAATKLALVTTVGCSTSHATEEPDAALVADSSIEADAAAFADASTESDASLAVDAAEGDLGASGRTAEDCVPELELAAAQVDPNTGTAPPGIVDESRECCEIVHASVDVGDTWGEWPGDPNLRPFCCGTVFEWNAGGSCTPWGPPMPPAMPAGAFA